MVSYRAQADIYRVVIRRLRLWGIDVATVDPMQGKEAPMSVFDVITTKYRKCPPGFVKDADRLNVASTRAILFKAVICHRNALAQTAVFRGKLAKEEDPENQAQMLYKDNDMNKHLQGFFDHYKLRHVCYWLSIFGLAEYKKRITDVSEADCQLQELEAIGNQRVYRNCGEPGHIKDACDQPPVPKCKGCRNIGHERQYCTKSPCVRCKADGHVVADCPELDHRVCGNCYQSGHIKAECTNPRVRKRRFVPPIRLLERGVKPVQPRLDDPQASSGRACRAGV